MKNIKTIQYALLLVFFIANSAYRLGTGFDGILVRVSFFALLFFSLFFNRKLKITSVLIWEFIFWSYYYLSMTWAIDASDSLHLLNVSIQIIGIVVVLSNLIETTDDIKTVLKLFYFSIIYAMFLLAIRTPISAYGTERVGEVIGQNSNGFGMLMAIGAILTLHFWDNRKEKISKVTKKIYIVLLILFALFTLLSGSRKALFLLIVGGGSLYFFVNKGTKKLNAFIIISVILPLVIYLIFNNNVLYSVIGYRVEKMYLTITNQSVNKMVDRSYIEREFYRKEAINLFSKNPIHGVGGNNFSSYMRYINYSHIAYSHNNYTELLATLGIIGFGLYYYFFIALMKKLIKLLKIYPKDREIIILFLTILIMFLFMDYGLVSYCEITNAILVAIIDRYLYIVKKEKNGGEMLENS